MLSSLLQWLDGLWLYAAFGCAAGILSGLFGIGGGVVIVPFLVWTLHRQGIAPSLIMILAVATSLATIIVTSMSAVYAHHRLKAIDWPTVGRLSPGILLGSALGSVIADQLPVPLFKTLFAAFLLVVAGRLWLSGKRESPRPWQPGRWLYGGMGLLIGGLSAILGIGGGTLSVPFLVKCRWPMRQAVAISSACGFPIAVAGTAAYIVLGWNHPMLPKDALGYVYLPAFVGIVSTSMLFAPVGAALAHWLPTHRLKRGFALVLLIIGGKLLWQLIAPG